MKIARPMSRPSSLKGRPTEKRVPKRKPPVSGTPSGAPSSVADGVRRSLAARARRVERRVRVDRARGHLEEAALFALRARGRRGCSTWTRTSPARAANDPPSDIASGPTPSESSKPARAVLANASVARREARRAPHGRSPPPDEERRGQAGLQHRRLRRKPGKPMLSICVPGSVGSESGSAFDVLRRALRRADARAHVCVDHERQLAKAAQVVARAERRR